MTIGLGIVLIALPVVLVSTWINSAQKRRLEEGEASRKLTNHRKSQSQP